MPHQNLFHSACWMEVLQEGLGAEILELKTEGSRPFPVPVFRKGPFRVLYPGFPVGDIPPEYCALLSTGDCFKRKGKPIHMTRIWQSHLLHSCRIIHDPACFLYETVIEDLEAWSPERMSSSLRKNLKRAEKSGLHIEPLSVDDAPRLFRLYESTVNRHGGSLRYGENYFRSLATRSMDNDLLDARVARTPEGKIAGVIVAAYHNGHAFYLHAVMDKTCRSMLPSDRLLFEAIGKAREAGMKSFSFLPSPIAQPGLIRFKEKWGGTTFRTPSHDLFAPSPTGASLRLALALKRRLEARQ